MPEVPSVLQEGATTPAGASLEARGGGDAGRHSDAGPGAAWDIEGEAGKADRLRAARRAEQPPTSPRPPSPRGLRNSLKPQLNSVVHAGAQCLGHRLHLPWVFGKEPPRKGGKPVLGLAGKSPRAFAGSEISPGGQRNSQMCPRAAASRSPPPCCDPRGARAEPVPHLTVRAGDWRFALR